MTQELIAEWIILGTAMSEGQAATLVFSKIGESPVFSEYKNTIVWKAIRALYMNGSPVDDLSVHGYLMASGEIDRCGGPAHIAMLVSHAAPPRLAQSLEAVWDAYQDRHASKLIDAAAAAKNTQKPAIVLKELIGHIGAAEQSQAERSVVSLHDTGKEAIGIAQKNALEGLPIAGVSTGFKNMDVATDGFEGGKIYVIAARPAMGKTSFMIALLMHQAAIRNPGVVFSLEMSRSRLMFRIMSSLAGRTSRQVKKGIMSTEQWEIVGNATDSWKELPIFIDDASRTAEAIIATARVLKKKKAISWIMIDYLQIMSGDKSGNRDQFITEVCNNLQALVKSIDIFVILLAQINRGAEKAIDKRPALSHLRESGGTEIVSDFIGMLFRPGYYGIQTDEAGNHIPPGYTELIIGKSRDGETGVLRFNFEPETMSWSVFEQEAPSLGIENLPF